MEIFRTKRMEIFRTKRMEIFRTKRIGRKGSTSQHIVLEIQSAPEIEKTQRTFYVKKVAKKQLR